MYSSNLLEALKKRWEREPDLRLLQLLINVSSCKLELRKHSMGAWEFVYSPDPFYVSDQALEARLEEDLYGRE